MLRAAQKYFAGVSPVFIDGLLYLLVAAFGAMTAVLSTDEAAKFIEAGTLFGLRAFCTVNSALWLALKMFRSTAFAEHREEKKQTAASDQAGVTIASP